MPDEIKTGSEATAKPTNVEAAKVAAPVEAAKTDVQPAKGADKAGEATAKSARKASAPVARKTKTTTKTAARKSARTSARKTKTQRRPARNQRQPETIAATERNQTMNFDPKTMFGAFGAMPTAPFQSLFADAGERGQEVVRRSQKAAEDLADLTRANVEAVVESSRIAAEGARSIGQDVVETSREGIEQAADAVRLLAEAKSATEFVQLQSDFARSAFDRMVSESSRLTESMVKLAGEAFQPLSSRASVNAERLNKIVA